MNVLPSSRLALASVCLAVAVIGMWNALHYSPGNGYDAAAHMAYADGLVPGGRLPEESTTGEYFNPPGFYAAAGAVDWLAGHLGISEPHRATLALNVLLLLGTMLLASLIARELWPDRPAIGLAAAAFVGFVPVTVKAAAMFHPETATLFLSTLAVWLCIRTFSNPRLAYALGLTLGAAQLVRAFALWTVAAVVLALLVGRRIRPLLIALALAVAVPAPWYIHQVVRFGSPIVFNRSAPSTPLPERRPTSFYLDPGLPAAVTHPYRPHFTNRLLPTVYTELWGDYFGVWVWKPADGKPTDGARHRLELQSILGVLPSLLALGGIVALLRRFLRSQEDIAQRVRPVLVLPGLGLLGFLFFTVSYPSNDGDVLKATYLLSTVSCWAVGFGYAIDRIRGRWRVPAFALLAVSLVAELPFLLY